MTDEKPIKTIASEIKCKYCGDDKWPHYCKGSINEYFNARMGVFEGGLFGDYKDFPKEWHELEKETKEDNLTDKKEEKCL